MVTSNINLNSGIKTIYEKLLKVGDILVLVFPTTQSEKGIGADVQVVFFRVTRKNLLWAKAPLNTAWTTASTLGFDRLTQSGIEHTSGKQDILNIANINQFYIYHYAWCTDQNSFSVKLAKQNPAGYLIDGFVAATPPAKDLTDPFGWVYDQVAQNNSIPTEVTEDIAIYNVIPNFAVRNETGATITSGNVIVAGAGYQLSQIVDERIQDKIMAGAYPALTHVKTFGSLQAFNVEVPEQWTAKRLMTSADIDKLIGLVVSEII